MKPLGLIIFKPFIVGFLTNQSQYSIQSCEINLTAKILVTLKVLSITFGGHMLSCFLFDWVSSQLALDPISTNQKHVNHIYSTEMIRI